MRKLSQLTKLGYGVGSITFGIKDAAFNTFLMFYYTQVLGLKGSIAGIALMIGLVVDAVADPIMGSISDNFSSKYGRRHPFMLISAIPMGIFMFALFSPMKGLGQTGLFLWMTFFVLAVRICLTVYMVPYLALGAELTADYVERTQLSAYRTSIQMFGGIAIMCISFAVLFKKSAAYEVGQMNAAVYPFFGLFCSVLIVLAIFGCVYLTGKEIKYMPKGPANPEPFSLRRLYNEIRLALMNPTFRILIGAAVFLGVLVGTTTNLHMIVNTYFWEFKSENLAVISTAVMLAAIAAFIIMKKLERYNKQRVFIGSCVFSIFNNLMIILRLFDLLPPNGDPLLLKLAYLQIMYTMTLAVIQLTLLGSIVADSVDEGEKITNLRQEGIYVSFFSFSSKAVSGFGALIAGVIIDFIGLPPKADPGTVDPAVIFKLGVIVGPVLGMLWIIPIIIMLLQRMVKGKQQEPTDIILHRNEEDENFMEQFEPELQRTGTE